MTAKKIDIEAAAEFLLAHDNYTILSHANPDGDTAGCGYALCRALRKIGKKANVLCADSFSRRFSFMWENLPEQDFTEETVISVDVADSKLLGANREIYEGKIKLAIDHHISHVDFAESLCLEPYAAACGQTIFKIIKAMEIPMDKDIAACLYTAIATDSGCFKFSSVTPETHMIAAELLAYDFGFSELNYILFDLKTKERIALEENIYSNMKFYLDGQCAIIILPRAVLDTVDSEDSNGISAIPRQIEGVEVGVVLKEKKDGSWKASLRANSRADVQKICSVFGGGGHKKAAGCTFTDCTPEQAIEKLVPVIREALEVK